MTKTLDIVDAFEVLRGATDDEGKRWLSLEYGSRADGSPRESSRRMCPIEEFDALEMLDLLRSSHVVPPDGQTRSMLGHLLPAISKLFAVRGLESLALDVVIHENEYDVVEARLAARHDEPTPRKHARHERDVKGFYKPSGRQ